MTDLLLSHNFYVLPPGALVSLLYSHVAVYIGYMSLFEILQYCKANLMGSWRSKGYALGNLDKDKPPRLPLG